MVLHINIHILKSESYIPREASHVMVLDTNMHILKLNHTTLV